MKKLFFFAALAAAMASCTSEEPMMVSNGTAIGFDTYVGKATRAGDINTANLEAFYVYGGKTAEDFKGSKVSKTEGVWTYSPTQYWEEGAKYTFAAVAPTNAGVSFDGSVLTVADYTPGEDDLIVAVTNEITGKAAGSNAVVNLNFKHALAKVQLTFTGGDASKVSNVKLTGVNNKATLKVDYATGTNPAWDETDATDDYEYAIANGKGVKFLLPQELNGAKVSFTYNGENIELEISTAAVSEWEMGKGYNYTITLPDTPQDAIEFGVEVEDAAWNDYINGSFVDPTATPEEPGDDEEDPSEVTEPTQVPGNLTLSPTIDTWLRPENNTNYGGSEVMEILKKEDGTNYYGLIEFELPSNLKQPGYKIDAKLRLVTVSCKGDRNVNLHEYTGNSLTKDSKYDDGIGEECKKLIENNDAILSFSVLGKGTTAMKDINNSDTDEYKNVSGWTNTIDLSEFISSKEDGSKFALIISKKGNNNNSMQFASKETGDIPYKDDSSLVFFKKEDLVPQLTITYTKITE